MRAIILAAGVGRRLYGDDDTQPPKSLLRFAGTSLLRRHIEMLRDLGIDGVSLVVGYRKDEVLAEAEAAGRDGFVRGLFNPRFREGSVVSMWTARDALRCGDDILFMDADVLYHRSLLERLVASLHGNCFLLDREVGEGEDPVRLCIRGGHPVDFGKMVEGDFDLVGEWPGFMRLVPPIAGRLADMTETYVGGGRGAAPYEDAIRDVLHAVPPGTFGFEDITGTPWIEIDFPEDLARAEKVILPRLGGVGPSPKP
ncbi:MAG: phosphocholine cytidylyltransferase family protein [Rhodospirillales bacterium]|jgi:choline kinase|nr:phosphocholine cytidylyltransferase family protein [Rhodospirillales bacterium]MDP6773710.1 phosphocholine cytidylyltransferase family protein [Rhodospirillales bacterium]